MVRAIGEVDQLFRMIEGELRRVQRRSCLVTRVRRRDGVAAPQLLLQRAVRDGAGPSAIAHARELAIPVLERQPDLEEDVRLARGLDGASHAAERRQVGRRVGRARECERPGDRLRRADGRVGQLLLRQIRARRGTIGLCARRCDEDELKDGGCQGGGTGWRLHVTPPRRADYTDSLWRATDDALRIEWRESVAQYHSTEFLKGPFGSRMPRNVSATAINLSCGDPPNPICSTSIESKVFGEHPSTLALRARKSEWERCSRRIRRRRHEPLRSGPSQH